jgi:hypothetical protein
MSGADKIEVNGNGVHHDEKVVILDAGAQYGKVSLDYLIILLLNIHVNLNCYKI